MEKAYVVRGHLKGSRQIELDEPVRDLDGPVEVTVRPLQTAKKPPLYESLSPEEWEVALREWIESHDPNLPVLPAEALRRESMYEEKL